MAITGNRQLKDAGAQDHFDHSFTSEVFSTLGWCAGFAATGLFTVGVNGIAAFSIAGLASAAAVLAVGVGFFYLASLERKKEAAAKAAADDGKTVKVELAQGQHTVTIDLNTPGVPDRTADQPPVGKFTGAIQAEREQQASRGVSLS